MGQVAANAMGANFGSLPAQFGFTRSDLNPAPTAVPFTGTNSFGVPGNTMPQTSNVQSTNSNPTVIAAGAVQNGPFSQPAFAALVSMMIGVFILAVVAHVEAR